MAIVPIGTQTPVVSTPPSTPAPGANGPEFANTLTRLVSNVEQSEGAANDAVSRMLDGSGDVHEAMIALQRADLAMQMTVQVRNKLVQAYQEIMRMPV